MKEFLTKHAFKISTGILLVLLLLSLFKCSEHKAELKVAQRENDELLTKNGELLIQRETACREAIERERINYQFTVDSLKAESRKVVNKAPRPVAVRVIDTVYSESNKLPDTQVIVDRKGFEDLKAYQDSSVVYIESLVKTIRDKDGVIAALESKNNISQIQIDNATSSVASMETKMDNMLKAHEKEIGKVRRRGWAKAAVFFGLGFLAGRI